MANNKKKKLITSLACAVPAVIAVPTLLATVTSCKNGSDETSHIKFSEGTKKEMAVPYFDDEAKFEFLLKDVKDPSTVQVALPTLEINGTEVKHEIVKNQLYTVTVSANGTVKLVFDLVKIRKLVEEESNAKYDNIKVAFSVQMKNDQINETIKDMSLTITVYDYEVVKKPTNCTIAGEERALYGEDYEVEVTADKYHDFKPENGSETPFADNVKVYIAGFDVTKDTNIVTIEEGNAETGTTPSSGGKIKIAGNAIIGKVEISAEATPTIYNVDSTTNVSGDIHITDVKTKTALANTATYGKTIECEITVDQTAGTYNYIDPESLELTIGGEKVPTTGSEIIFTTKNLYIPGKYVTGDIEIKAQTKTLYAGISFEGDTAQYKIGGDFVTYQELGVYCPALDLDGTITAQPGYQLKGINVYEGANPNPVSKDKYSFIVDADKKTGVFHAVANTFTQPLVFKPITNANIYTGTNSKASDEQHILTVSPAQEIIEYGSDYIVYFTLDDPEYQISTASSSITVNGLAVPYKDQYLTIVQNGTSGAVTIKAQYFMDVAPQGGTVNVVLRSKGKEYGISDDLVNMTITKPTANPTHGTNYTFELTALNHYTFDESTLVLKSGNKKLVKETGAGTGDYELSTSGQVTTISIKGNSLVGDVSVHAEAFGTVYNVTYDESNPRATFISKPDKASYTNPLVVEVKPTTAEIYDLMVPTVTIDGRTLAESEFTWAAGQGDHMILTIPGDKIVGNVNIKANAKVHEFKVTKPTEGSHIGKTTIVNSQGETVDTMNYEDTYTVTIEKDQYTTIGDNWNVQIGAAPAGKTGWTKKEETATSLVIESQAHIITGKVEITAGVNEDKFTFAVPTGVEGLTSYTTTTPASGNEMTHFGAYEATVVLTDGYDFKKDAEGLYKDWDILVGGQSVKADWGATLVDAGAANTYKLAIPANKVNANFAITVAPSLKEFKVVDSGLEYVSLQPQSTPTYGKSLVINYECLEGTSLKANEITVKQNVGGTMTDVAFTLNDQDKTITIAQGLIKNDIVIAGTSKYSIALDSSLVGKVNFTSLQDRIAPKEALSAQAYTVLNNQFLVEKVVKVGGTAISKNSYTFENGSLSINQGVINGDVVISGTVADSNLKFDGTTLIGYWPETTMTERFSEFGTTLTIPANVTSVKEAAFTSGVASTIPSSTTASLAFGSGTVCKVIGKQAFAYAPFATVSDNQIQQIDESAFAYSALTEFTFKLAMTQIGSTIFSGCASLAKIDLSCYTEAAQLNGINVNAFGNIKKTGGTIYVKDATMKAAAEARFNGHLSTDWTITVKP